MVMFRILGAIAALGASAAAYAAPPSRPKITQGEFAACAKAADEPICLLKLATKASLHRPNAQDIRLAYAPEVLAAVGDPDLPFPEAEFDVALSRGERAAAAALLAEHRGAAPDEALAVVRAISYAPTGEVEKDMARLTLTAVDRVKAYQTLWEAAHGPAPIPPRHRPSEALVVASLAGWEREIAASDRSPEHLIAAHLARGDRAGAARVARSLPRSSRGRVEGLLAADLLDEAATEAFGADNRTMHRATALRAVMTRAEKDGRKDLAVRAAETVLRAAMGRARFERGDILLAIPDAVVVITDMEPPETAAGWLERLEAASAEAEPTPGSMLAGAASYGWSKLGRQDRVEALTQRWRNHSPKPAPDCPTLARGDMDAATTPECVFFGPAFTYSAAILLARSAAEGVQPLPAFQDDIRNGRSSEVLAAVERQTKPAARIALMQTCAEGAAGNYIFPLALECARRLASAVEPESTPLTGPLRPRARKMSILLYVAGLAARRGEGATAREALGLAYPIAAGAPDVELDRDLFLVDIAIALLREQGRL